MANERLSQRQVSRRSQSRDDRRRRSAARSARRRLVIGIVVGSFGLALIVSLFVPQLTGVVGPTNETPIETPSPRAGTQVAIQAGGVIEEGMEHSPYSTVPATSGPRYASPAPWGASEAELPEEAVVANLERGGVAISYNLADDAAVQELTTAVEGLTGYPACVVLQPHDGVAAGGVSLAAWGWLDEVDGVDEERIRAFFDSHRNRGPLFIDADCGAGI